MRRSVTSLAVVAACALASAAPDGDRRIVFRPRTPGDAAVGADEMARIVDLVSHRLAGAGIEGPVATSGVEVVVMLGPDVPVARVRALVEARGVFEFRAEAPADVSKSAAHPAPAGYAWLPTVGDPDATEILVETPEVPLRAALDDLARAPAPDAEAIAAARAKLDRVVGNDVFTGADLAKFTAGELSYDRCGVLDWALKFEIVAARKQQFTAFAARLSGRRLAVVVDGRVVAAPRIAGPVPGKGEIRGLGDGFKPEEARDLAAVVRHPATGAALEFVREETR